MTPQQIYSRGHHSKIIRRDTTANLFAGTPLQIHSQRHHSKFIPSMSQGHHSKIIRRNKTTANLFAVNRSKFNSQRLYRATTTDLFAETSQKEHNHSLTTDSSKRDTEYDPSMISKPALLFIAFFNGRYITIEFNFLSYLTHR